MHRYIDADKLVCQLKERYDALVDSYEICDAYTQGFCEALDAVEDVSNETPTADVQKVKHGKWIIRDGSRVFQYYDGTISYEDCGCSICGKWGYSDMKYCPHCGARMDGENHAEIH